MDSRFCVSCAELPWLQSYFVTMGESWPEANRDSLVTVRPRSRNNSEFTDEIHTL